MIDKVELVNAFDFIRNGASIKQEDNKSGYPITRIETIWNETIDSKRLGFADIFDDEINQYEKYILQYGDILMTHINSPKHLGKCAIYKGIPEKLIHGMNLLCLRPNNKTTIPQYILYFFNSKFFRELLPSISNQSVNQASFNVSKLKNLQIPLPPLPVQQKIAAILDAADELRQKDKALLAKYEELTQALFLDMFGDPVSNPKGWEEKKLEDVCLKVTDGTHQGPKFIDAGIPFLLVSNIVCNKINYETKKYISEIEYNAFTKSTPIEVGDILYTSVGSYGNPAIVLESKRFCFQRHIAHLKPNHTLVNVVFLHSIMLSPMVRRQADKYALGVAQKTLNLKVIKKFNIFYPPINLQNQFAERVKAIEAQKAIAQASAVKSEELFNSLLQKAFNGELV